MPACQSAQPTPHFYDLVIDWQTIAVEAPKLEFGVYLFILRYSQLPSQGSRPCWQA